MPVTLTVVLFALSAPPADPSANWPHWRGPSADGAASATADPPLTWDAASGKNVRWKAPLVGKGSVTPIVWGDQVFVLSAEPTDRQATAAELPKSTPGLDRKTTAPTHFYRFLVTSYDRGTGAVRWRQVAAEKVPHEGHHETHTYAGGSPTTDGKRLYVSFGSFGVYCYDLAGKLLWSRDIGRINSRLGWGEAVTPVVHDDDLLLNWDQEVGSALYCLDAATGATKWKADRDERSTWTTPLVAEFAGRTQVIVNGTTRIRSHDLKTGQVLWSCGGMTVNPIPSAVRVGDSAVVMSGYRGAGAVSVPLGASGDLGDSGPVNWRHGKGTPYVPSAVRVGTRLYFTEANTGTMTVLDALTGKAVIDRERLPGVGSLYASPVYAGGRVYFVDRQGTCVALKPGDAVEVLATNKLGDGVDASPVAVGKELFLRGQKFLYCLAEPDAKGPPAVALFDGSSLTGWEGDTAKTWRVEDGSIVGGSLDAVVPRNEFLSTTKTYTDFDLSLRFKLIGDPAKANAGVQLRTRRIPNHHEVIGYQADIGQGYWGALYDESRRNKVLAAPDKGLLSAVVKHDDWNEYRIRAEGPRIQLWLNGVPTVDYTEPDPKVERSGVIALQVHGGAKAKVWYTDIVIKELPAAATPRP